MQPADATRNVKQVGNTGALASQQAVQTVLGALLVLVVGDGRGEAVVVLLQDGDDVVVAELHRFIHRRVAPPVHEEKQGGGKYSDT